MKLLKIIFIFLLLCVLAGCERDTITEKLLKGQALSSDEQQSYQKHKEYFDEKVISGRVVEKLAHNQKLNKEELQVYEKDIKGFINLVDSRKEELTNEAIIDKLARGVPLIAKEVQVYEAKQADFDKAVAEKKEALMKEDHSQPVAQSPEETPITVASNTADESSENFDEKQPVKTDQVQGTDDEEQSNDEEQIKEKEDEVDQQTILSQKDENGNFKPIPPIK